MRASLLAVPLLALAAAAKPARAEAFLNTGAGGAFLNLGTGSVGAVVPPVSAAVPYGSSRTVLLQEGSPVGLLVPIGGVTGPMPSSLLAVQLAAARNGGAVVLSVTGAGAVRPLVIPPSALGSRR